MPIRLGPNDVGSRMAITTSGSTVAGVLDQIDSDTAFLTGSSGEEIRVSVRHITAVRIHPEESP